MAGGQRWRRRQPGQPGAGAHPARTAAAWAWLSSRLFCVASR